MATVHVPKFFVRTPDRVPLVGGTTWELHSSRCLSTDINPGFITP